MKLLWLCNMMPGKVKESITGNVKAGGLWVDQVLEGLRQQGQNLRILCPGDGARGQLDENCSFRTFPLGLPYEYRPQLEEMFREELKKFQPDVIHIWGTEYAHTLAMVNACREEEMLDHTVVSIQGLCSVYAGHYDEGLPGKVCREYTLRDLLRQDNIWQQRRKFALRGQLEVEGLRKVRHVIGRTDWDRACTKEINPNTQYHFCNETLREVFYEGTWQYNSCQKHRIFASSCVYPVKGFHYLLEAFREVVKRYPDATLAVPGTSCLTVSPLRQSSYQKYLAKLTREYGLEDKVEFLGSLSAQGMKENYLRANVFAMPSTIENSPNSLGEAMLLGVPCVAAHVGGVANLLKHESEGLLYQSTAPYMLAHYIMDLFAREEQAQTLGQAARDHARLTHDPQANLTRLVEIYQSIRR